MKKIMMGILVLTILCGCQKDEQPAKQEDHSLNIQTEVKKAFDEMDIDVDFQEITPEEIMYDMILLSEHEMNHNFEANVAKTIYEDNIEVAHMFRTVTVNDFQEETMEAHIEVDGVSCGQEPLHYDIYTKDHEYYLDFDSKQYHILWENNSFYTNEGFIFLWTFFGEIKEAYVNKSDDGNTYRLELEMPVQTSRRFIGLSDIFDNTSKADKLTIYLKVDEQFQIKQACDIFYGKQDGKDIMIKEVVTMNKHGKQEISFPDNLTSWEDYEN